jgi:hypothetical protein
MNSDKDDIQNQMIDIIAQPSASERAARYLDGREYPLSLSQQEIQVLREHCLVVVHPHSDDTVILSGAISDDHGVACDGDTDLTIHRDGFLEFSAEGIEKFFPSFRKCEGEEFLKMLEDFYRCARSSVKLSVNNDWEWRYKIDVPCEEFRLMEEGKVLAVCLVFKIKFA